MDNVMYSDTYGIRKENDSSNPKAIPLHHNLHFHFPNLFKTAFFFQLNGW